MERTINGTEPYALASGFSSSVAETEKTEASAYGSVLRKTKRGLGPLGLKGDDGGKTRKPLQFDALVRLGGDRGDHRFSYSKNRKD